MSNVFTLDSMREELDRKYAPVIVDLGSEQVELRSLLRLKSGPRKEVATKLEELKKINETADAEDEDTMSLRDLDKATNLAEEILYHVADKPDKLIDALDGDMSLIMQVFEAWMGDTQAGEADSSES